MGVILVKSQFMPYPTCASRANRRGRSALGEDGLLRVRDVEAAERLVEAPARLPHQRPRAHPRRRADGFHAGEAHAAQLDRQASLRECHVALALRGRRRGHDPMERVRHLLVVYCRRAASMVTDGGIRRFRCFVYNRRG